MIVACRLSARTGRCRSTVDPRSRQSVSAGGAKAAPPAVQDAVRTMLHFIRTHQPSFADPLPYAIDSTVEACLVAFPGVRAR